jgi:hypothetical protein
MIQQFGNAIPSPGFSRSGFIADQELLASTTEGSYFQKGVTLAPGQGLLLLGTLLKRNETTKYYEKTTVAADAEGILRATTETGTDPNGATFQANILFAGILQLDKVKAANSGVTIGSAVLDGRVDEKRNYFKF